MGVPFKCPTLQGTSARFSGPVGRAGGSAGAAWSLDVEKKGEGFEVVAGLQEMP